MGKRSQHRRRTRSRSTSGSWSNSSESDSTESEHFRAREKKRSKKRDRRTKVKRNYRSRSRSDDSCVQKSRSSRKRRRSESRSGSEDDHRKSRSSARPTRDRSTSLDPVDDGRVHGKKKPNEERLVKNQVPSASSSSVRKTSAKPQKGPSKAINSKQSNVDNKLVEPNKGVKKQPASSNVPHRVGGVKYVPGTGQIPMNACRLCHVYFKDCQILEAHNIAVHGAPKIGCDNLCGASFSCRDSYRKHVCSMKQEPLSTSFLLTGMDLPAVEKDLMSLYEQVEKGFGPLPAIRLVVALAKSRESRTFLFTIKQNLYEERIPDDYIKDTTLRLEEVVKKRETVALAASSKIAAENSRKGMQQPLPIAIAFAENEESRKELMETLTPLSVNPNVLQPTEITIRKEGDLNIMNVSAVLPHPKSSVPTASSANTKEENIRESDPKSNKRDQSRYESVVPNVVGQTAAKNTTPNKGKQASSTQLGNITAPAKSNEATEVVAAASQTNEPITQTFPAHLTLAIQVPASNNTVTEGIGGDDVGDVGGNDDVHGEDEDLTPTKIPNDAVTPPGNRKTNKGKTEAATVIPQPVTESNLRATRARSGTLIRQTNKNDTPGTSQPGTPKSKTPPFKGAKAKTKATGKGKKRAPATKEEEEGTGTD